MLMQDMYNPNISDYSPGQLRSTPSYIFQTGDILGEGATSKVFLGRHKKSGEKVAVKVFNHESFQRPNAVQEREFEVLLKIKHTNIVKLLAIENDQITKNRLIVLELCDCSVLNLLDQPEYVFGFPDKGFLLILGDTTSGMRYLQEQGIVHRDIKPGNIMRKLGPDRTPTYKLADFGAARHLQPQENFTSLYGTEEYLHPDMFEKALLKLPVQKYFNAKVDLWSFGVTIYHIVTGVLPFRPFGGRHNRNTMHKITTQKASGVISAVQRESEDGPIEYGSELPKNCRLSFGLKILVTDILIGLLESNTERMWSFESFFPMVQSILNKRVLDVLNVSTGQLIKVYVDPNSSFAEFQEHVAMQTSIPADLQVYIYDSVHFHPEASITCALYPTTTEEDPILLIPRGFDGRGFQPVAPNAPSLPDIKTKYSLDADYPLSRLCAAGIRFMQWKQRELLSVTSMYTDVAKSIRSITSKQVMQLQVHFAEVKLKCQHIENCLTKIEDKYTINLELVDMYSNEVNGDMDEIKMLRLSLIDIQDEVSSMGRAFLKITRKQSEASTKFSTCIDPVPWHNTSKCREEERCCERLDMIREIVDEIMKQYRRDRKTKNLGYNEIQIHKMDKFKLKDQMAQATSLIRDHCEKNWRISHANLMDWFRQTAPIQENIHKVDRLLTELITVDLPRIEEDVEKKCTVWDSQLHSARQKLMDIIVKTSKVNVRRQINLSSEKGTFATSVEEKQALVRKLSNGESVIYLPPNSPNRLPGMSGGPRRLVARGPSLSHKHTSNRAHTGNMIPVPKALKKELEYYSATSTQTTKDTIAHSQQLMKEMNDVPLNSTQRLMQELNEMSLGIPDSEFNFVN